MVCSEARSGLQVPLGLVYGQGLCVWVVSIRNTVEAGCATFGDVVGVLNAGVSVTLGKGIGVAGTDMAAP